MVAPDARERPAKGAPEHEGERQVEPRDSIRARPDDVAHFSVAAVHDPGIAACRRVDGGAELLERRQLPAGVRPVERVDLAEGDSHAVSDRATGDRLSGAHAVNDVPTTHDPTVSSGQA